MEEALQQAVLKQIKTAEHSAYDAQRGGKAALPEEKGRQTDIPNNAADATAQARRLAHAAIDFLTYDELRALKMPFGVMLDAIRTKT